MKTKLVFAAITLCVFLLYSANAYRDFIADRETSGIRMLMPSVDVVPNSFLPYLLLKNQTLAFDSIIHTMRKIDDNKENPYFLINTHRGYYSAYPVLTGILAIPTYIVPIALDLIPDVTSHNNVVKVFLLGRFTASLYAALSVGLMYLILQKFTKRKLLLLMFLIFYAFGTSTWSVSSRGLWQHTTSQFLLSGFLLLAVLAETNRKYVPWTGMLLGLCVIDRPTNIIFALFYTIYVLLHKREFFWKFTIMTMPSVVFMFLNNKFMYGSFLTEGYGARNDFDWSTPLLESIPAYFVSPARGFLFISPVLLVGFWSMIKFFTNKSYAEIYNRLFRFLSGGYLGSMLLFGKWYTWDGANAFGNRMLSDFLPFIALFAFLKIRHLKKWGIIILTGLIIYSVGIHYNAVINRKSRCDKKHNWDFYCISWPKNK